jgi:hypothetical protein
METPQLPPDLQKLERLLAERDRPQPSPDLKERVIRSVEAEPEAKPRQAELPSRPAGGWWTFAAATAASVVLLFNLSLSAARATSYDLDLAAEPQALDASVRQIRELLPQLSHREAIPYAVAMQADLKLARCPNVATADPVRRLANLNDYFSKGE